MKRYWKKILFLCLVVAVLPLWVFGDPPVYFAEDSRGQVVDAETGRPLAGVIVFAEWQPTAMGIGHSGYGAPIYTIEVRTDEGGNYFIPSWGPRIRWPFTYLNSRAPRLRFFKPAYYPESVDNALLSYENRNKDMVRTSEWNGKTIQLIPFKGDWEDYAAKLSMIWSDIGDCLRDCPRLVVALDAESKRIQATAPREKFIPSIVNIDNFQESDRHFLMKFKNGK